MGFCEHVTEANETIDDCPNCEKLEPYGENDELPFMDYSLEDKILAEEESQEMEEK